MSTSEIKKYRIFCKTDHKFEFTWDTTGPTQCPIDGAHDVNLKSISVMDQGNITLVSSDDSPYKIRGSRISCDTTNGNIILLLPKIQSSKYAEILIKKQVTVNDILIQADGSELINSASTYSQTGTNDTLVVSNDAVEWSATNVVSDTIVNDGNITQPSVKNDSLPISVEKGEILVGNGTEITVLNVGSNGQSLVLDDTQSVGMKWSTLTSNSSSLVCAFIYDKKNNGTNGGTFTKDVWNVRELNTINTCNDTNSNITLSSNRIKLKQGKYHVSISCPAHKVEGHQAQLYDYTNSIVVEYGTTEYTRTCNISKSFVVTYLNVLTDTEYEIRHRCEKTNNNDGYGRANGFGNDEIYTYANILKLE